MNNRIRPPSYPAIRFLVDFGTFLAILVALIPFVLGAWALASGYGWLCLAVGIAVGLLLGLVLHSYVEVLRILSETLMPR